MSISMGGDLEDLRPFGFVREPVATHTSRTIMLVDAEALFGATSPDTPYHELERLVVSENILGRRSQAGRLRAFRYLRELYGLQTDLAVYSGLRFFWARAQQQEYGLLAIAAAAARDLVLFSSADHVLSLPPGAVASKQDLEAHLRSVFPSRYSDSVFARTCRNLLSSWTQSGHLSGHVHKVRSRAPAGPASTGYALFLGHLTGARGAGLFGSVWAKLLDAPPAAMHEFAFEASKRGWIDYRRGGDVVDVGFPLCRR